MWRISHYKSCVGSEIATLTGTTQNLVITACANTSTKQNSVGAPQVVSVDNAAQLFRLLALNRIEVALSRWMGEALIRQQGIKGVHALEPPLATREMFIYLHKRHAALAPKLAEALRAIKAEGLYDRLHREKVLLLTGSSTK